MRGNQDQTRRIPFIRTLPSDYINTFAEVWQPDPLNKHKFELTLVRLPGKAHNNVPYFLSPYTEPPPGSYVTKYATRQAGKPLRNQLTSNPPFCSAEPLPHPTERKAGRNTQQNHQTSFIFGNNDSLGQEHIRFPGFRRRVGYSETQSDFRPSLARTPRRPTDQIAELLVQTRSESIGTFQAPPVPPYLTDNNYCPNDPRFADGSTVETPVADFESLIFRGDTESRIDRGDTESRIDREDTEPLAVRVVSESGGPDKAAEVCAIMAVCESDEESSCDHASEIENHTISADSSKADRSKTFCMESLFKGGRRGVRTSRTNMTTLQVLDAAARAAVSDAACLGEAVSGASEAAEAMKSAVQDAVEVAAEIPDVVREHLDAFLGESSEFYDEMSDFGNWKPAADFGKTESHTC